MLQTQRYELKYLLDEHTAKGVRDFIQPYLEADSFGRKQTDLSYPVHTLYLDSPDLTLHQSTINGDRNRFKLRLRFYEGREDSPLFCEIKSRRDSVIFKERCLLHRASLPEILAGRYPETERVLDKTKSAEATVMKFCQRLNELRARPITLVSYRREAWTGQGHNRVRVTFDREVVTKPEANGVIKTNDTAGIPVFGRKVVLELKFTGRFPDWMHDLVQIFQLRQTSAAKYVDGLIRLEERQLLDSSFPRDGLQAVAAKRGGKTGGLAEFTSHGG